MMKRWPLGPGRGRGLRRAGRRQDEGDQSREQAEGTERRALRHDLPPFEGRSRAYLIKAGSPGPAACLARRGRAGSR
ncbi:MAG: hypothetical protein MZV64_52825 [Ignavibacteriales bacterium]|nr:hypothetical protein [Ignavibacteriales bacterium]